MRLALLYGAALAAVVAPAPAVAVVASPAASVSADAQRTAADLARVMNSEDLTRAQIGKMLDDTLPRTLAATPTFAEMERTYPGIVHAFVEAMRPIIVEGTVKRLPTLWVRLTPIYTRAFSPAELKTLLDFYTSPAGTRLIKAMGEGADYSRMMGDMIANGNQTVTTEGLRAGTQSGVAHVVSTASADDIKAMQALAATSAGQKLPAVNQQLQAEAAAWGNEPEPQLSAQVDAAVKGVVAKYIGKPAQ